MKSVIQRNTITFEPSLIVDISSNIIVTSSLSQSIHLHPSHYLIETDILVGSVDRVSEFLCDSSKVGLSILPINSNSFLSTLILQETHDLSHSVVARDSHNLPISKPLVSLYFDGTRILPPFSELPDFSTNSDSLTFLLDVFFPKATSFDAANIPETAPDSSFAIIMSLVAALVFLILLVVLVLFLGRKYQKVDSEDEGIEMNYETETDNEFDFEPEKIFKSDEGFEDIQEHSENPLFDFPDTAFDDLNFDESLYLWKE
jgi:hypothetical protein